MFDIRENLKNLPDKPGVYIYRDAFGEVIYIGKAISLKNRVRQYFQSPSSLAPKVRALVSHIDEFDYIITDSEMEALILECNLIKKHMPRYNILLRDDKTYPYIKITLNEAYPRLIKTRKVYHDGCKYFGPYTDVGAVNQIIDLLNRIYPLKKCSSQRFPQGFKPCLNYHIGQCIGVCTGNVNKEEYKGIIDEMTDFLQGKNGKILASLSANMNQAAATMNFEKAAEYRDYISAVHAIGEKQKVVLNAELDIDVILTTQVESGQQPGGSEHGSIEKEGTEEGILALAHGLIFFVRQGKLSGRENYQLQTLLDEGPEKILTAFIEQYYSDMNFVPKEILVEEEIKDKALLEAWLSELKGSQVKITVPKRGEKKALLAMAKKNVQELSRSLTERASHQKEKMSAITNALSGLISDEQKKIRRIEAYDISNTSGADSVGVMVVFEDGKPKRKDYRRFRIKTIEGPNDYGSLQEVVYRRFTRYLAADAGFSELPDLLLIDGGENQVSVVKQVLVAMKIDIPVAGMVKDDRHRTRGLVYRQAGKSETEPESGKRNMTELILRDEPILFNFIAKVQEEVHRFAIGYHRGLRIKTLQKSALDDIEGIGIKRRNALLSHFGSIEKIKAASLEELCGVPGMNKKAAEKIILFEK